MAGSRCAPGHPREQLKLLAFGFVWVRPRCPVDGILVRARIGLIGPLALEISTCLSHRWLA
jgi:hypothetical protein